MKNLYSTKRLIVRKERRKSWELSRMSIFALQKKPRDGKEENGRPIGKTPNINIRHSHTLFPPPISLCQGLSIRLSFSPSKALSLSPYLGTIYKALRDWERLEQQGYLYVMSAQTHMQQWRIAFLQSDGIKQEGLTIKIMWGKSKRCYPSNNKGEL